MDIDITQADIDLGIPSESKWCPVALATIRHLGINSWVAVGGDVMRTSSTGELGIRTYDLPEDAIEFILRFDEGEDVKPFTLKVG